MEKNKKAKLQSRRGFLSLAAVFAAARAAGKAAKEPEPPQEKVKMLTPDGQLVEVDKKVLDQAANRKKVTNKEILEWRNPPESF